MRQIRKQLSSIKFDIPVKTRKKIDESFKKRPLEDVAVISRVEDFFKKTRGYVFKLPEEGTPVILLLSGGLDTSVMWDILMSKYKLHVYPVFFRRGQIRMPLEEKSVDYFSEFYAGRYPKLFHKPKKLTAVIPPLEIRWDITRFGGFPISKNPDVSLGIPGYSSLLVNYAIQYSYFLQLNHKIKIRDIFCGFMPSDGQLYKYETLTALRSNMFNICNMTNDYTWQFTSLALERELGFLFEKDVLINWAKENNLPLEKSNSCIKFSYFHCGECGFCKLRRSSFKKSGIGDKTIYINNLKPRILFKILNKVLLSFVTAGFLIRIWFEFAKNFIYFFLYRH